MGIFNPDVNTEVTIRQPSNPTPSAGQALIQTGLNLFGAAAARPRGTQESATDRRRAVDQAVLNGYQDGLLKAEALRKQGKTQEAERLETRVALNAQRAGLDLADSNTQAAYTAVTGRSSEQMFLSPQEVQLNKVLESDEYQTAYLATFANGEDMTEQERQKAALTRVTRQQSSAQQIVDENISWTEGKRDAFTSVITDFNATVVGTLNQVAIQNKSVPLDTLRAAKIQWEQTKSVLTQRKPEGVTAEQWKDIQNQMSQVDEQFKVLENISSPEGIEATFAQAILQGIQAADWSDGQKMIASSLLKDPAALAAISPKELKGITEALISDSFTSAQVAVPQNASGIPDAVQKSVEAKDAKGNFEEAKNLSKLLTNTDKNKVSTDPQVREDFVQVSTKAFAAMNQIGKENRRFVSAEGINQVFSGEILAGIQEVAKHDPAVAANLLNIGFDALDNQFAIVSQQINGALSSSVFVLDGEGLRVDGEKLKEVNPNISEAVLQDAVNRFYDGDYMAMIKDGGRRISGDFGSASKDFQSELVREFASSQRITLGDIEGMVTTRNTINDKRQQFRSLSGDFSSKAEPSVQNVSGVKGFDTIKDDREFLNGVASVGQRVGTNPEWLLQVMSFETISTFSPFVKNPTSSATGLIQFMDATAKKLGTTTEALATMTRTEQLEYVERYFLPYKGKLNNLGDVYMAVLWPAGVGKSDSFVLWEKGSKQYKVNANLDVNGDGTVTRGEAVQRVINHNSGQGGVPSIAVTPLEPNSAAQVPTTGSIEAQERDIQLSTPDPIVVDSASPTFSTTRTADPAVNTEGGSQGQPTQPEKDTTRSLEAQRRAEALGKLKPANRSDLANIDVPVNQIPNYNTEAEVVQAIDSGEIQEGQIVIVEGVAVKATKRGS